MSTDLKTVKVLDSRLDVTPELKYAVLKGGQNVTSAKYPAIGVSTSQITFNIQVP